MDGKVAIEVELGTKGFEKQIAYLERQLNDYVSDLEQMSNEEGFNEQSQEVLELKKNIETLTNKISSLKTKQEELDKQGMPDMKQSMNDIGNSTESVIKKVAKWGLAVFGVRSAYMFIRQSMSALSQYNEKIGSDIQYIRFALATALQPIIEAIINLVYKLLAYINYIAKAWFGVNLFANASAKAFQKVNKGVKDTNKSAKQLQKTLAGFDEMNILQENGSVSSGGGGGGITSPSMDLSKLDDIEIPGWVKWIGDNKDKILNTLKEIGAMLLIAFAVKNILEFTNGIEKIGKLLGSVGKALGDMSNLQIFGIITGIALTIWGIVEVIRELTSENKNLIDVLNGLSDAFIGIGLVFVSLNASNLFGWVAIGIGLLGNLITSLFDTRTDAEKLAEANKNLEDAQKKVNDAYNEFIIAGKSHLNAYKNYQKAQEDLKTTAKKLGMTTEDLTKRGEELFNEIKEHPEKINELSDRDEELYEAYLNLIDAEGKLKKSSDTLTQSQKTLTDAEKNNIVMQLDKQKVLSDSIDSYEDYRDAVIDAYEKGALTGEEASSRLVYAFNRTKEESKQTFVDAIPGYMQDMMKDSKLLFGGLSVEWRSATDDMKIYTDSLAGKFNSKFGTEIPNSIKKTIDKMKSLTKAMEQLPFGKSWSVYINSKLSGSGNAKGAIYFPPKLAVGGIINQPGRGVPLAMGGERGAEGVIPLTDAQQMQRLGEAIGRYITVNAQMNNYMNGRLISRELQQIQNEEDFAFNGG